MSRPNKAMKMNEAYPEEHIIQGGIKRKSKWGKMKRNWQLYVFFGACPYLLPRF